MDGITTFGMAATGGSVTLAGLWAITKYYIVPQLANHSAKIECLEEKVVASVKLLRDVVLLSPDLKDNDVIKADLEDVRKILKPPLPPPPT